MCAKFVYRYTVIRINIFSTEVLKVAKMQENRMIVSCGTLVRQSNAPNLPGVFTIYRVCHIN